MMSLSRLEAMAPPGDAAYRTPVALASELVTHCTSFFEDHLCQSCSRLSSRLDANTRCRHTSSRPSHQYSRLGNICLDESNNPLCGTPRDRRDSSRSSFDNYPARAPCRRRGRASCAATLAPADDTSQAQGCQTRRRVLLHTLSHVPLGSPTPLGRSRGRQRVR